METFLSFLTMLFFVGLFLAAFLVTGGGVLVVLGKLFNRIVSYWEQSFRYPLWLRTEKNILIWLYIVVVAYLFFLALFVDMNVAGVSTRLSSDVINLRRFTNSIMGAIIFLLNLPLIPLLWAKYPLKRDNCYLGRAWRLWKVILWVILVELILAVLSVWSRVSELIGDSFHVLYFWWDDVRLWLAADGQRTLDGFNYPAFQYIKRFMIDLFFLAIGYCPFALFHNRILQVEEAAMQKEEILAGIPQI